MSQVAVHPAHRLGPQPELIWSKNTEAFEKNACSSTVIGFWENATYLATTLGWEREAPQAFQSILVGGSAMPISFCYLTIQPLNVNENKICLYVRIHIIWLICIFKAISHVPHWFKVFLWHSKWWQFLWLGPILVAEKVSGGVTPLFLDRCPSCPPLLPEFFQGLSIGLPVLTIAYHVVCGFLWLSHYFGIQKQYKQLTTDNSILWYVSSMFFSRKYTTS